MKCISPFSLLLAGSVLLTAAGCPSALPPNSAGGGSSTPAVETVADKADDVKTLEAAEAALTKDSAGHVTAVELNPDTATDEQLVHLKGLPNVVTLDAGGRGVTDKGLAALAGHPSLRTLRMERALVTNAGMALLKDIPKLEEIDLKRTDITAEGFK